MTIEPLFKLVLDAVRDWRAEWLVPVVCDADTISEGDEYLALVWDRYVASVEGQTECGNEVDAIGVVGVVLRCSLPRGHEYDGTDWHSDGQAKWKLTTDAG